MSIKVYIHLKDVTGYPDKTSKLAIPKAWVTSKTVADVMGLFTKAYNDKAAETEQLDVAALHLEEEGGGTKLYSNDVVEAAMSDHSDYYLKPGAHLRAAAAATASAGDSMTADGQPKLRCKNYGCNKYYVEAENSDEACQHHTGPPIFHDTMKCWSCCRDRKAYDFESFQLIVGCNTGRHSDISPAVALGKSPNAPAEASAEGANDLPPPPALKTIDAYNAANPDAASAASSAAKTLATRKSTRQADGSARCQRKGCQKTFLVEENGPTACTYHQGQPVFHDAVKFWSCCPEKKCYDFDAFLTVPGCAVGCHDDGVIDLS